MNKIQALHDFWSRFGLKAYDENSVPVGTTLPYLTYEVSSGEFGDVLYQTASLWYRSSSWAEVTSKEMEISRYISRGGRMVVYDGGAFWIVKATPWAQRMSDSSDEMIKRIVLNVELEFLD